MRAGDGGLWLDAEEGCMDILRGDRGVVGTDWETAVVLARREGLLLVRGVWRCPEMNKYIKSTLV